MRVLVIIASDYEWANASSVLSRWADASVQVDLVKVGTSIQLTGIPTETWVCRSGWGKVSSAASARIAIAETDPDVVLSIGTSGGLPVVSPVGSLILGDAAIMYDIRPLFGNVEEDVAYYSSVLASPEISSAIWEGGIISGMIGTADRDIYLEEGLALYRHFSICAFDWESASIAFVSRSCDTPCCVLRVVSDELRPEGKYDRTGHSAEFSSGVRSHFVELVESLPNIVKVLVENQVMG